MNLTLLIGSLAAVLALAMVARLLGLGGGAIDDAGRTAEEALAGFVAEQTFVSENGAAALIFGRAGEVVLVKQHGTGAAVRRLARPIRATPTSEGVEVDSGEFMFGRVRLQLSPEQRDKLLTML